MLETHQESPPSQGKSQQPTDMQPEQAEQDQALSDPFQEHQFKHPDESASESPEESVSGDFEQHPDADEESPQAEAQANTGTAPDPAMSQEHAPTGSEASNRATENAETTYHDTQDPNRDQLQPGQEQGQEQDQDPDPEQDQDPDQHPDPDPDPDPEQGQDPDQDPEPDQAPQDTTGRPTVPNPSIKVVITLTGTKALVGVKRTNTDPFIEVINEIQSNEQAIQQAAQVLQRATEHWADNPRRPKYVKPKTRKAATQNSSRSKPRENQPAHQQDQALHQSQDNNGQATNQNPSQTAQPSLF